MAAGVHWGHRRSKRHPAMTSYVWGLRANVEVIDLVKTKEKLAVALEFLRSAARDGRLFLFVGTRPSVRDVVKNASSSLDCPYVDQRWIGGTLTNFKIIRKRVETMEAIEHEFAAGELERYTKRERIEKERELERLRQNFDGLRRLTRLPDALILVGLVHEATALRESRRTGIRAVALVDTDADPRSVAYPIPANDDARPAVTYLLGRMAEAIRAGRSEAQAAPAAPPAADPAADGPKAAAGPTS